METALLGHPPAGRRDPRTRHCVLALKICRYLSAAAMRHTAVVSAFRAHSANSTFWGGKETRFHPLSTVDTQQGRQELQGQRAEQGSQCSTRGAQVGRSSQLLH